MAKCKPPTLVQRLRELHNLCDPDCYGRCRVCPQTLIDEAIRELEDYADIAEACKNCGCHLNNDPT